MSELTKLQVLERQVLLDSKGSRSALVLIGSLRQIRQEICDLKAARSVDGICAGPTLNLFFDSVDKIEELEFE